MPTASKKTHKPNHKKVRSFNSPHAPRPRNLSERIYDAIKNAREAYANTDNALSGTVEKCEEYINTLRGAEELQQFISTGWLKRMPTGHLYIQLA